MDSIFKSITGGDVTVESPLSSMFAILLDDLPTGFVGRRQNTIL